MRQPSCPPPRSNRLSASPNAPSSDHWDLPPDSSPTVQRMVDPDDLSVVYQPIVRLDTGKRFAYEALVRCQVAEFAYPPDLFRRAVATGCAGRLGRMIREIAVPLCNSVPLFLNVHPQELNESWLVRPDDPIFFHDHDVFLEITESVPLTHFELCISVLSELRSRGDVRLVVDDLGAGYSNLKTIADLEPNVVKLDRDLVAGIDRNERQRRLVAGVVGLCGDLDALVVAEGIETPDEFQAVCDAGAHFGQGFLFARPSFPKPEIEWTPAGAREPVGASGPGNSLWGWGDFHGLRFGAIVRSK